MILVRKPTGLSLRHRTLLTASDDTKSPTNLKASTAVVVRTNLEQAEYRGFKNFCIFAGEKNNSFYSKKDCFLGGADKSKPGLASKKYHGLADFVHVDTGTGFLISILFSASLIYVVDKSATAQYGTIESSIGRLDRLNRVSSILTY